MYTIFECLLMTCQNYKNYCMCVTAIASLTWGIFWDTV